MALLSSFGSIKAAVKISSGWQAKELSFAEKQLIILYKWRRWCTCMMCTCTPHPHPPPQIEKNNACFQAPHIISIKSKYLIVNCLKKRIQNNLVFNA